MKVLGLSSFVLLLFLTSGCSLYYGLFGDAPGIYMTGEEEIGGRLELDQTGDFWYYWELSPDTFGISHGSWDKRFNKIILTSADSVNPKENKTCNVLTETYNDTIRRPRVKVVNTMFGPVYRAAWIVKHDSVLASGLTTKSGHFYTRLRAGDSLIISSPGSNMAKYQIVSDSINDVKIQLLHGQGKQYVTFEDAELKMKKDRLELEEGGNTTYMGTVFYKYFEETPAYR